MELETSIDGQTLVVYLYGDLDLNIADRLRDALDKKIEETAALNLVVDLSNVNFIDSSGLGVLLGRYKRVSKAGGKVYLSGAKPHVRSIIELSGLLRIMEEFSSTGEALGKIG
jgi:stage II sporulation protein AA (anti-sigma F factor antagonist)